MCYQTILTLHKGINWQEMCYQTVFILNEEMNWQEMCYQTVFILHEEMSWQEMCYQTMFTINMLSSIIQQKFILLKELFITTESEVSCKVKWL